MVSIRNNRFIVSCDSQKVRSYTSYCNSYFAKAKKIRRCIIGRHYYGDIEGKFWFGVQPSDAASRFGSGPCEAGCIEYYFDMDNLDSLKAGITTIETRLDGYDKVIEEFFSKTNGYNDKIVKEKGLDVEEFNKNLGDYADLLLGRQILECVMETGHCAFSAEL